MDKTFSLRRQEIVEKESVVEQLKERWPVLFTTEQVNNFLNINHQQEVSSSL